MDYTAIYTLPMYVYVCCHVCVNTATHAFAGFG